MSRRSGKGVATRVDVHDVRIQGAQDAEIAVMLAAMPRFEDAPVVFPEDALADLQRRLDSGRWPSGTLGKTWRHGTAQRDLSRLVRYWRESFDWRRQERALNAYRNLRAEVRGVGIHFVLAEGRGPDPLPLVVTHGWPSSLFEILPLLPRLTDPVAFGGVPEDSFTVIAPSLPGYGLSDPIYDTNAIVADLWHELATDVLGYQHYGAQGGDLGSRLTVVLARRHPESLVGIHLHSDWADPAFPGFGDDPEEREFIERDSAWEREEDGYGHIQGTKPQTLGYALADSPIGLAAWILEKFSAWGDGGDDVVGHFGEDALLANITLYWLTNSIATSFLPYYNSRHQTISLSHTKVEVPTGIARFPADEPLPPGRSAAERQFDLRQFTEMPRGGHFPGFETPELLVEDIRRFFRPLRPSLAAD